MSWAMSGHEANVSYGLATVSQNRETATEPVRRVSGLANERDIRNRAYTPSNFQILRISTSDITFSLENRN